jgi:GT2 family glycosyltransferase
MISTVIVQYDHPELTREAVDSLRRHHGGEREIIVVDNASPSPETRPATDRLEGCRVIFSPENRGFGAANNTGARASRGDLLLFLNSDTIARGEFLLRLEAYFGSHSSCGAAGLQLLNPDGTVQISAGRFPTVWTEWRTMKGDDLYTDPQQVRRDWVSGAALAVRRRVFEDVGGFDERYFMYFEDIDLCARIHRAGHDIHYLAGVCVEHLRGGSQTNGLSSFVQEEYRRSQLLYYSEHATAVNNVLLRGYLLVKFLRQRLVGSGKQRAVASDILSTLFRNPGERRH